MWDDEFTYCNVILSVCVTKTSNIIDPDQKWIMF